MRYIELFWNHFLVGIKKIKFTSLYKSFIKSHFVILKYRLHVLRSYRPFFSILWILRLKCLGIFETFNIFVNRGHLAT